VPKVQHKPIKRSKLGFKRKEQKKPKRTLVWGTRQCPACQGRSTPTLRLRVSKAALRYNSLDCPVCHRTVWCACGATTTSRNGQLQKYLTQGTVRAESERSIRGAPDSEQYLSGAAPNCPVPQEDKASNSRRAPNPNGWVTWRRTRLSGAPIASSLP
jgi:hypothetical protein